MFADEAYGMRIKGILYITPSKMIDSLISIIKAVLSDKIRKRIHVHKTVDTLYEHFPRDILPAEFGRKEKSLKALQDDWCKLTTSKEYEDFLRNVNGAKTNELYRQTSKFNEHYIGMPGTFRTLK